MATQAGMGLSKALILVGAGFTGSIVLRNHKLSDILGDLQAVLTGMDEKSTESSNADSESSLLASQLDRLAREVQRMASSRPITVLNGNSSQAGNITSLVVPVASLGILGYGYMWWKGLSFSDLMYVTKSNMANAVSSMTKHLEQVSAALAATKRHLTQRLENLDGKLDEQKEMSTEIKREVTDAVDKLSNIGNELNSLQELVWGLNGKVSAIEDKQNFACTGVMYLCRVVGEKVGRVPEFLQDSPKPTGKCGYLGCTDTGLKELQQIADAIESGNIDKLNTNVTMHYDISSLGRTSSFK